MSQQSPDNEPTRLLGDDAASDVRPVSDVAPVSDVKPASDETTDWSNIEADVSETLRPPSMPSPVAAKKQKSGSATPFGDTLPEVGETIDDFQLTQELGRGAMGVVFLAKQISLGREVALKVSKNIGDEAQTMAAMEHRHIVQVYSESIIADGDQRLLCMQFVPGVTIEKVINKLRADRGKPLTGRRVIDIIDDSQRGSALLDPDALHDRVLLAGSNREETICRIGIWLSEALEYAHRRGVLHRDIKPANIMIDPYGHPRLADFSLSALQVEEEDAGDGLFGGTLNYMAPEHLRAFVHEADEEDVDQRSDIYGLGLVLFELLTLHQSTLPRDAEDSMQQHVRRLIEFRNTGAPALREHLPEVSTALERTFQRCLDPDPARRFQSAEELASALRGCLELWEMEMALPPEGRLVKSFGKWSVYCVIALTLVPHLLGSVVNISYNMWIVSRLNADQQATFNGLVLAYNLIIYPACIWAVVKFIVLPAVRNWRALENPNAAKPLDYDHARAQALSWPRWAAILACIGWFPGAVFFPLGLQVFSPPVTIEQAAHFVMSIALSGLIALTYSVVGLQWVSLRAYYPRLWDQAENLHATARRELASSKSLIRWSQVLAGFIPLLGAGLLVIVGNEGMSGSEYRVYQALILGLIILGFGGFQLALTTGSSLVKTIDAMTGRADQMSS